MSIVILSRMILKLAKCRYSKHRRITRAAMLVVHFAECRPAKLLAAKVKHHLSAPHLMEIARYRARVLTRTYVAFRAQQGASIIIAHQYMTNIIPHDAA